MQSETTSDSQSAVSNENVPTDRMRNATSVDNRGAIIGALTGAVVCGLGRASVVIFNIGHVTTGSLLFSLPSATIGLMLGAIAGRLANPGKGAAVGGLLSGVVFGVFMLPIADVFGTVGNLIGDKHGAGEFLTHAIPWFLEMVAVGAIAGAVGGFVGQRQNQKPEM